MVVVIYAGGSAIVKRFEAKPFDASELKQILVKDDGKFEVGKSTIELAIGQPYAREGASADDNNAVYYTDNYVGLIEKAERNQRYALLAIERGDSRISGLLTQAKALESELETLAYGSAEIAYDDYSQIKEVVYNSVVIDAFPAVAKKLDTLKIFNVVEVYADQDSTTRKVERLTYMATYLDGSFIYGVCNDAAVVLEDGTVSATYEGSCAGKTLKWQDDFGQYEAVAPAIS